MSQDYTNAYLFVYGTLRKDYRQGNMEPHPMHQLLWRQSQFIDMAWCRGRLFDLGNYPGLATSSKPQDRVMGELYRLHSPRRTLPILDNYEGYRINQPASSEYLRIRIPAVRTNDRQLFAWAYCYNKSTALKRHIVSGNYCEPRAEIPTAARNLAKNGSL